MTEKLSISDRLRALRGRRNKADFARFLGIPAPVYQRYENGRVPNGENLSVISLKCGVSLDWLLRGEGAQAAPPIRMQDGTMMAASDHTQYMTSTSKAHCVEEERVMYEIGRRIHALRFLGPEERAKVLDKINDHLARYAAWCATAHDGAREVAGAEQRMKDLEAKAVQHQKEDGKQ